MSSKHVRIAPGIIFALSLGAASAQEVGADAALAGLKALVAPGPQHAELAREVGTWDMEQTLLFPGAPPKPIPGTMVTRAALGGRYFISEVKMISFLGPYEAIGTTGYDKARERYTHTWTDTMGTGMMISFGNKKADGSLEFVSEPYLDQPGGAPKVFRMVTKIQGKDKMTFEMFSRDVGAKDDEESPVMRIVYTRKK